MKYPVSVCILVMIILPTFTMAQSDSAKKETTVIFFGSEAAASKSDSKYDANAVKLGIFEMIQGLYGFSYERELSDLFSIQAGLGLTGRNWTYGVLGSDGLGPGSAEQSSPTFTYEKDYIDEDYDFKSRKAAPGFYIALQPKFYYADEDGMDGTYLGLNFQYRRYNYDAFGTLTNDYAEFKSGNDIREFEKQTILALSWGYQNMNEKTVIDYHIAAGIRNINGERRDLGYVYNPSIGSDELTVSSATRSTSGGYFFFEMGLKVGMWWKGK